MDQFQEKKNTERQLGVLQDDSSSLSALKEDDSDSFKKYCELRDRVCGM